MKLKINSYFNKFRNFNTRRPLKTGNIVARKSYNKDILFTIDKIIGFKPDKQIAILKGLNVRIVADSPLSDLVLIDKTTLQSYRRKQHPLHRYNTLYYSKRKTPKSN